jgi:hypothetical protein
MNAAIVTSTLKFPVAFYVGIAASRDWKLWRKGDFHCVDLHTELVAIALTGILGRVQFHSRWEHRIYWLRFLSRFRQIPWYYLDEARTTLFPVLSILLFLSSYDWAVHNGLTSVAARSSVVGWGIMLLAGMSRVRFPMRSFDFSIYLILPAALWPWGRLSL